MKLFYQTHSPYARKVLVAAHEIGLADRLEVIHHETSPTRRNDEVFAVNPLGKVPALLRDDGPVLFDSAVIIDYLDTLHDGPKLVPVSGPARYEALRLQALATGMSDAGITVRWEEERRPEALRWPVMRDGQAEKLIAAYDFVEATVDFDTPVDIGQIALATSLSWLEFRNLPAFRPGRPRLTAWYERFVQRPSMLATLLEGQTHD